MDSIEILKKDLIFVDIETTGLNPSQHEIIEIGCLRVRSDDHQIVSEFETKVMPLRISDADPESLELINYKEDDWLNAHDLNTALTSFNDFSVDGILAGWNISFDWSFLSLGFYNNSIQEKFDYHRVDIMTLGYEFLLNHRDINTKGLGLRKFAKFFDIPFAENHSALKDAQLTFEVYKKLKSYEI